MIPTKRLVILAFCAALVAAVAENVSGRPVWIAFDVLLVVVTAADAWAGLRRGVSAERRAAEIFSVGRANAVVIVLRNDGDRSLRGTVMDDPLEGCEVVGLPGTFELTPLKSAQLRYEIVPKRRGKRRFGAVTVRYALPFGMLARQQRIELAADVDVYPDVHGARMLELLRRQGREDARLGSLRAHGGDTEFERLRPYQRGDEVRHIDWRASARRSDLVVRQYEAESNQNVVFALDLGRGMRGESRGLTSVDHALAAALLTADVALRTGDKAGLFTFDEKPRSFLRPTGGSLGGRKLTRAAYALDANLTATDYRAAMLFLKTRMRARSLFVVFTNVLDPRSADELAAAVKSLVPRHLPLCVLLRDVDVEALATAEVRADVDAWVRAAAGEALTWRDGIVRSLEAAGALVLDARPEEVTPLLVKRYLEVKARRLL